VEELMSRIKKYNAKNKSNPIGGIRVYSCSHNAMDDNAGDVFIMPYLLNDNKDYPSLSPSSAEAADSSLRLESSEFADEDEDMILNNSRKCPPFCPPPPPTE